MKGFLTVLCLLFSYQVYSQSLKLSGFVFDEDKQFIRGARISVVGENMGVFSKSDGSYELLLRPGKWMLRCKIDGGQVDTFLIENLQTDVIHDFYLKDPVQLVEQVKVTVGKFDKPIEEQTVTMLVLKPELIENKNTRSIETALDQTPGLNILDGEPQIRGGSGFTFGVGSKVAVIVDDMPMLSGDAGRPEWGFIPVENISQVEVTKGASSVLSGSSALSGSIHIRTAYPKAKPLTKIQVYSGAYSNPLNPSMKWNEHYPGIHGLTFLHTRRIGNLDLVVGGNLNQDHGYIGPPKTDSLVATVFPDTITNFSEKDLVSKRARVNFNLRYRSSKIKGLSYGVNGNFMKMHTAMPLAWLNDSSGLYRAYPGAIFLQDQFIFNVDPFLHYLTENKGKHYLRSRLLKVDNEMSANQSNKAMTYYGDYMFQKKLTDWKEIEMVAGMTGTLTKSEANIYSGSGSPNNDILNVSIYSQVESKWNDRLNVSAGGRFEYFQLNDTITATKPIFRAGSTYRIHKATFLRASYGQGFRFPTITERYIKTGVGNFGVFPNPNLKPESSWNAEIGIKHGIKVGNVLGYLDIAGFWQEYQNTIEYMFGIWHELTSVQSMGSSAGFMFLNTGNSRVTGIDVSYAGKAQTSKTNELTFLLGYNYIVPITLSPNYVYATDSLNRVFSYQSTSLDPSKGILKYRFLHNVKLDAEHTWNKKYAIGVSAKYFSKIVNMDAIIKDFEQVTVDNELLQDLTYMDYFQSHRFGNWIFDARLSFHFSEQHKFAIIGSNIFNRTYSLRPLKIEAPRTVMIQYTYRLEGK
jgi:outer membrane receptor protein involved in Fe transport